jgi:hypothetical protein
LIIPLALAACATTAPEPAPIGSGSGHVCRKLSYEAFIGRVASSEVGAELLRASGAKVIRWVQPGMMVTMDYREDRLTVRLASNNRIISTSCG